jgi:hypothetical protein
MHLAFSAIRAFQFPYLHFTIVCLVLLALFLYFWSKRFGLFWGQYQKKKNPPAPYDPRLYKWYKNAVTFWSVMVFIALVLLMISFYLADFQLIAKKVGVSGLVTRRGNRVEFVDAEGRKVEAEVKGPQIAAAGIFMRFPSWMDVIGLYTYHRLITFRGMQQNEFHYGKKPDKNWLASYVDDPVLLFLYNFQDTIRPLLNINYIESVYFKGSKERIIVTPQGYIIQ